MIYVCYIGRFLSDGSLVKGEYVGVTYEMGEEDKESSILTWEWMG